MANLLLVLCLIIQQFLLCSGTLTVPELYYNSCGSLNGWIISESVANSIFTTNSCYFSSPCIAMFKGGTSITTPPISTLNYHSIELHYEIKPAYLSQALDKCQVRYSIDNGTNWQLVEEFTSSDPSQWYSHSMALPPTTENIPAIHIQFNNPSIDVWEGDVPDIDQCFIDNVRVIAREMTVSPTLYPTPAPTTPTLIPTKYPTINPTILTSYPTTYPTINPTINPSVFPTVNPTNNPSTLPTIYPTSNPTLFPVTSSPTLSEHEGAADHISTTIQFEIEIENNLKNKKEGNSFWTAILVVMGSIVICIIIFCSICFYKLRTGHKTMDINVAMVGKMSNTAKEENESVSDESLSDKQNENGLNDGQEGNMKDTVTDGFNEIYITKGNDNEIREWLSALDQSYVEYENLFVVNGYDSLEIIKEITDVSQLEEIGIELKEHQSLIMKKIRKMQTRNGSNMDDDKRMETVTGDENNSEADFIVYGNDEITDR